MCRMVFHYDEFVWAGVEKHVWITGIALSAMCLIIQASYLIIRPKTRTMDQKILVQVTVARFVTSVIEYFLSNMQFPNDSTYGERLVLALYGHAEIVLLSWMSLYTKNLYDKIVRVFVPEGWSYLKMTLIVWLPVTPVTAVYPYTMHTFIDNPLVMIYEVTKTIVLIINLVYFCKIFYVIRNKQKQKTDNNLSNGEKLAHLIKICSVSFLLISISGLEVLTAIVFEILRMYFHYYNRYIAFTVCFVNSFQAIAILVVFFILLKNSR